MHATDPTTSESPTPAQQQPSPAAPKISSEQIYEFYTCWIWAT